jgi:hypothetical protein
VQGNTYLSARSVYLRKLSIKSPPPVTHTVLQHSGMTESQVAPVGLPPASTHRKPCEIIKKVKELHDDHLKVDRGDPLSIGTAIHMMTAAVRSCKVNDRGFLYEDIHNTGTRVTYLSEKFSLLHFVAVLKINLGTLSGFRGGGFNVRFQLSPKD